MNTQQNTLVAGLKSQAKVLRASMAKMGVTLTHSQCLETVAQMHGHKDWNTASAITRAEDAEAPIFTVRNHHHEGCGTPPRILDEGQSHLFRSYFENEHGEQAIFVWDYDTEEGTLHLGDTNGEEDAGWDRPAKTDLKRLLPALQDLRTSANGIEGMRLFSQLLEPGLILGANERMWLKACFDAVLRFWKSRQDRRNASGVPNTGEGDSAPPSA